MRMIDVAGLKPNAILDVGSARPRLSIAPDSWTPTADVYELDDDLVIEIELSGCEGELITTKVVKDEEAARHERVFYIGVEGRRDPVPGVTERFHNERWQGNFARLFRVPVAYDDENINAAYSDGLLRITVARKPDDSFQETTIFKQLRARPAGKSARRHTESASEEWASENS
jgi:HSP20 family molecular chaperone IbpA